MHTGASAENRAMTSDRSPLRRPGFVKEMLLTLCSAVFTGLAASILLVLLVFGCTNLQAGTELSQSGQLRLHTLDGTAVTAAPLLKTAVSARINGLLARVRVEQGFNNPSGEWMEGIYQFPLPPEGAVDRLRVWVGERVIEGKIVEKSAARKVYEKAKASGRKASLLSQQRPNIFTTSVANIAPGDEVRVVIEYRQPIRYDAGRYEWRFPLVIGPRYIPGRPLADHPDKGRGWARATDQVPDADEITPPVVDPAVGKINPVEMEITLNGGLPVTELLSQYHPVKSEQGQDRGIRISLAEDRVAADRDFLLSWRIPVGMDPQTLVFRESWQGEDYAYLMVMPPDLEPASQRLSREMIFVLDSSGSMHGASIKQAKAALRLALSRLEADDRFNLIHFNDRSHALFPRAMPGNQRNRSRAIRFIDALDAEGGTEMLPALRMALASDDSAGRLRQVVFLTDGSVGNEEALFNLIRHRLGRSRLFTIGIGSAPNSHFMQRAADFGRGSFTYIGNTGEVESRMGALFEKLESPAMSDIRIEWEGDAPLETLPSRLPDLYLGEPLMVLIKSSSLKGELWVEGNRDGSIWRHRVDPGSGSAAAGLHKFWAHGKIQALMSASTEDFAETSKRESILRLALRHQLVSPYTSLVAVERQPARPLTEPLHSGVVPVNLPDGWDAAHIFGALPQTATSAPLWLLCGLLFMLSGLWLQRRSDR